VLREEAVSNDGTRVPMTFLVPKGARRDGTATAVLYGYGGFGANTLPGYRPVLGAVVTQHPGLAKVVVALVGVFDSLRAETHPNGMFNTTEFGSVKDLEQFKALYAYSPYHRVRVGVAYPAMLLTGGENDPRSATIGQISRVAQS